jgi:hypothetical protein
MFVWRDRLEFKLPQVPINAEIGKVNREKAHVRSGTTNQALAAKDDQMNLRLRIELVVDELSRASLASLQVVLATARYPTSV